MGNLGVHFPDHVAVGSHGLEGLREGDFITVTLDEAPVMAVLFFPLPTLAERFKTLVLERFGQEPPPGLLEFLNSLQGSPN